MAKVVTTSGANSGGNAIPSVEKTLAQIPGNSAPQPGDINNSADYGTAYIRKMRTMRKHPTINLCRTIYAACILSSNWSYEATEDAPEGAKEFIEKELQSIRDHLLRNTVYGCIDFGFSPFEKVFEFKEKDKLWGIKKLKPLLQDNTKIQIDAQGNLAGIKSGDITLTLDEILLCNQGVEGTNWYGLPIMANCITTYDDWNITQVAAQRYDRKLAGAHWVVYYPANKTTDYNGDSDVPNDEIASTLLNTLEASGAVALPQEMLAGEVAGWKIELLSAYPTSNVAFIDRFRYLDSMFPRAFGLTERSIIEGQFGTKAEAGIHAEFSTINLDIVHRMFVQQYNWHLINHLLRINYGEEAANTVYIVAGPITDAQMLYYRAIYQAIVSNGDNAKEEYVRLDMKQLRDKLGLPENENADQELADLETEFRKQTTDFLNTQQKETDIPIKKSETDFKEAA